MVCQQAFAEKFHQPGGLQALTAEHAEGDLRAVAVERGAGSMREMVAARSSKTGGAWTTATLIGMRASRGVAIKK